MQHGDIYVYAADKQHHQCCRQQQDPDSRHEDPRPSTVTELKLNRPMSRLLAKCDSDDGNAAKDTNGNECNSAQAHRIFPSSLAKSNREFTNESSMFGASC
jgi:hypothetical protein